MNLYLKQKVFSIKGKFNVYDIDENPLYKVEGKVVSIHKKHFIYDVHGEQVAEISQKVISMMPKFYINLADGSSYEIKGKIALAHDLWKIKELGWTVRGKITQHDYKITDEEDNLIAEVHQKWIAWGDTYEISIADDANTVLVLAIMLCLDVAHAEAESAAISMMPDSDN